MAGHRAPLTSPGNTACQEAGQVRFQKDHGPPSAPGAWAAGHTPPRSRGRRGEGTRKRPGPAGLRGEGGLAVGSCPLPVPGTRPARGSVSMGVRGPRRAGSVSLVVSGAEALALGTPPAIPPRQRQHLRLLRWPHPALQRWPLARPLARPLASTLWKGRSPLLCRVVGRGLLRPTQTFPSPGPVTWWQKRRSLPRAAGWWTAA